ncbi:MgtC/SapB family protein [Kaistia nematophila]|uniref:Protein MgtC n=1 Tax=Kaistia nematophila TaxID=2994654 RepID=A0A9X3IN80_9HYPH|nr:MgtC/SapB family protein [Kaistia nematophila]
MPTEYYLDVAMRLGMAVLCGLLIGINRDAKEKPAGMRTLAMVSLGAALVAVSVGNIATFAGHPDAQSRVLQGVIQGVLAGIGFIGAGAILRPSKRGEVVHGVTTASTVWVSAALGIACGLGDWPVVLISLMLVFLVLVVAKPIERRWLDYLRAREEAQEAAAAAASAEGAEPAARSKPV